MATRTIALTIMAQTYAPRITRTANRTAQLLRTIPIRVGGGKNCAWVIKGTGATAGAMAEGANAGTPSNDTQHGATLNWGYYKADGGVTGPAQATSATAHSPDSNKRLLSEEIQDSIAALCSQINVHSYSGDPTASPVEVGGLDYALCSTTNTYAGLDRGTVTAAVPYLANPGSATPISLHLLRNDLAQIKVNSGMQPDLAFCHPKIWLEVAALFDANRRYMLEVKSVDTPRGTVKLDGSAQAINIDGCTFISDKDATLESGSGSGRIYYVNSDYVEYEVLPQPEIAPLLQKMGIVPGQLLTANDGFGEVPLLAAVVAMAKVGDADTYMAKTYLQLKVRSPKHCGARRYVAIGS